MNAIADIQVGSQWTRIASRYTWQVQSVNPNDTVTVKLTTSCYDEVETHDRDFFLGSFRQNPPENPKAAVLWK